MIHTVYIDDSTLKGRAILNALQKETTIVRFEKPIEKVVLPEGYMTGADFRLNVKQELKEKLKANGYL